VLVAGRAVAVGDVHVGEPVTHRRGHLERVRLADRGVREVQGEVREVLAGRVPVGGVRHDLPAAGPQREHVLHREADVGLVGHRLDPAQELTGVLALPAERRVHDHGLRAALLGGLLRPDQLGPRVGAPDPLGDHQAGRVHREDRHLVVVRQPPQRGDVLADRVGPDHDLDAVVAEPPGELEGVGRRLG
jgi:hypothetical protein